MLVLHNQKPSLDLMVTNLSLVFIIPSVTSPEAVSTSATPLAIEAASLGSNLAPTCDAKFLIDSI